MADLNFTKEYDIFITIYKIILKVKFVHVTKLFNITMKYPMVFPLCSLIFEQLKFLDLEKMMKEGLVMKKKINLNLHVKN